MGALIKKQKKLHQVVKRAALADKIIQQQMIVVPTKNGSSSTPF